MAADICFCTMFLNTVGDEPGLNRSLYEYIFWFCLLHIKKFQALYGQIKLSHLNKAAKVQRYSHLINQYCRI